jgi:hypothetical protein
MKPFTDPAIRPSARHSSQRALFKRQMSVLPFALPRLTDKAAAQLVDVLYQIVEGIEFHYAEQILKYGKRQQAIDYLRRTTTAHTSDPPF